MHGGRPGGGGGGGGAELETSNARSAPGVGALPLESVVDVVGVAGGDDHAGVRRRKALCIPVEHLPAPPRRSPCLGAYPDDHEAAAHAVAGKRASHDGEVE